MTLSGGGMMTPALAEHAPNVFAAVSPRSALVDLDHDLVLPEKIDPKAPNMFLFGDRDWLMADREYRETSLFVCRNANIVPMLTVGRVAGKTHANYPRESWIAYDEFLCRFSKTLNGNLYYMGEKVYYIVDSNPSFP